MTRAAPSAVTVGIRPSDLEPDAAEGDAVWRMDVKVSEYVGAQSVCHGALRRSG